MSNNNSDSIDYGDPSLRALSTPADDTLDDDIQWDWHWQYGAREGDQIAGNASYTMFTTGDNICEAQSPALTDNHTTIIDSSSDQVEPVTCSASGPSLLSANNTINDCACISCLWKALENSRPSAALVCIANSHFRREIWDYRKRQAHFKTHFTLDKVYQCRAPQCGQIFNRWGELTRHNKTHCLRPKKFACDVFGCKYGGDNGFIRHDKLLSHKRNVHDGKAPPSQLMRKLQAKPRA